MPIDAGFEKELAELVNGPPWQMADRLAERFSVDDYGEARGVRNELYQALDEYEEALRHDYGIELKVSTMAVARQTAMAWPDRTRVQSAPFSVHRDLRARPDRVAILNRLVKRHKGHVSYQQLRDWKADQNPKPVEPWLAMVERRGRAVASLAKTPEAKVAVAEVFDRIGADLRNG